MKKMSFKEKINSILRRYTLKILTNSSTIIPKKGPIDNKTIDKIKQSRENIKTEEKRTLRKIFNLLKEK